MPVAAQPLTQRLEASLNEYQSYTLVHAHCMQAPLPAKYLSVLAQPVAQCLKDSSQPVRLAAERTTLHTFQLHGGEEGSGGRMGRGGGGGTGLGNRE